MRRAILMAATTAVMLGWGATASAQQFAPQAFRGAEPRRPTVSPYLQLLQPQALGVPNYQTRVRPDIEMRQAEARNRQEITRLQREVTPLVQGAVPITGAARGVRPTGQRATFMNYLHYFPPR